MTFTMAVENPPLGWLWRIRAFVKLGGAYQDSWSAPSTSPIVFSNILFIPTVLQLIFFIPENGVTEMYRNLILTPKDGAYYIYDYAKDTVREVTDLKFEILSIGYA